MAVGGRIGDGFGDDYIKAQTLKADRGDAEAQNNLGVAYESGSGVLKDMKKAIKYYKLAADQGYGDAQYNLGVCY